MNRIALLLLTFVLVLSACEKENGEKIPIILNPTASQKGFVIEYTSTTCSICGNKGAPLLSKFSNDAPNGVVIAIHVNENSDPMSNVSLSNGFGIDRPSGGAIPSFWVGDNKIALSDDVAMLNLIDSGDAIAGVDLSYEKSGAMMNIQTKTKFFGDGTGDYFLSVYLIESGIDGSSKAPTGYVQPGTSISYPNDDYRHDFVIRAYSAGDVMGELIVTNPAADSEINMDYSIAINPNWVHLSAVVVLWKYDSNESIKYSYVNAMRR